MNQLVRDELVKLKCDILDASLDATTIIENVDTILHSLEKLKNLQDDNVVKITKYVDSVIIPILEDTRELTTVFHSDLELFLENEGGTIVD